MNTIQIIREIKDEEVVIHLEFDWEVLKFIRGEIKSFSIVSCIFAFT